MSIASTVRRLGTFLWRSGQVKLTPKREYLKRKEIKVDSVGNLLSPIMVREDRRRSHIGYIQQDVAYIHTSNAKPSYKHEAL